MENDIEQVIEGDGQQSCCLCGNPGRDVNANLQDRLFGVPGDWKVVQCTDESCGLAWISPFVAEDELAGLYENYYTHKVADQGSYLEGAGAAKRFFSLILKALNKLVGLDRQRRELAEMYLESRLPGRVIDMGCGDGGKMVLLRQLGWQVEGQDVDPLAVKAARELTGETVHEGRISDLELGSNTYDAVVMHHVLEHVADPVKFFRHCAILVKPGGRLVATVPNFASTRHRCFGRAWRGLEPPRHLYHFAPANLQLLAAKAGMLEARVFTSSANAEAFALASYQIKHRFGKNEAVEIKLSMRMKAMATQYLSLLEQFLRPEQGDECVFIWDKPSIM